MASDALARVLHRPPLQMSKIAKLPDEILDEIIRVGFPEDETPPFVKLCKAYMLVCHRWYRITVRYLFRRIRIDQRSPGEVQDFCDMLSRNPSIANAATDITIKRKTIHIDTLVSLLESTPRLQYLHVMLATIIREETTKDNNLEPFGNYKLKKFAYTGTRDCTPEAYQRNVMEVLQLFEELDQLYLNHPASESVANTEVATTHGGKLLVHALASSRLPLDSNHTYIACLHETGAFRNLTCLQIACCDVSEINSYAKLLSRVGPTLLDIGLHVDLRADSYASLVVDDIEGLKDKNNMICDTLRDGLSACTALHGFRLQMTSSWNDDYRFMAEEVALVAVHDWLLCVDILSLVADLDSTVQGGCIRNISFCYDSHQWRLPGSGFERLPWEGMSAVFRRFIDLKAISIVFHYPFDDESESGPDGVTLSAEEYLEKEMQEFKEIPVLTSDESFLECSQEGCRIRGIES